METGGCVNIAGILFEVLGRDGFRLVRDGFKSN